MNNEGLSARAHRFDFFGKRFKFVHASRGDNDLRAFAPKLAGGGFSNSRRSAGDDHDFTFNVHGVLLDDAWAASSFWA
ncbi:MAG: hypothetical protein IPG44_12295 [Anaerolineales bacterium]|nr:hypothetical protein [Anaerolineales bacterium]